MDHKVTYPFILLLALMPLFADAQLSQSCPPITINDLGSTTEFSIEGLVARAIALQVSRVIFVPVRIRNFAIVCDAAGDRINTSSFVSVVVEFQCDFQSSTSSLTVCSDPNTIVTRQYQFQCTKQIYDDGQIVWDTVVSNIVSFVQTLNPIATLSTPLVDTCRRCVDDRQSSAADPTTHCDPCPARCNQGQGRCFRGENVIEDVCCSFYFQNNCTDECPSGLVNNSNFICVCPPLTLGNGTVSYSTEMGVERNVGSVATHTCISGYQLLMQDEGNTRTCNISGWSGQDFICESVPRSVNTELIGGVVGTVLAVLMATIILLSIFCCLYRRYHRTTKMSFKKTKPIHNGILEGGDDSHLYSQAESGEDRKEIFVKSSFELSLPPHLIIPSSSIKLNEIIGQGEFGVVYKGYITRSDSHSIDEYLAIKTLKGFYDHGMVNDMLKECSRMLSFDHVNVLTVKGVCLDGGPAPYIIMPFMANGSLLAYLKKNRKSLIISSEDTDREDVEMVRKRLMDMCTQVAKGMEYLAKMKVVHRDLAARNCMIDFNFVIKVADFGLSESVGVKEYFHQDDTSAVKLPLKWLPPESINDHIFSEKSDVWAYGVTCWEIFSGGKVPYAELMVREIPKLLAEGYRLEKPSNDACSEEMYSFMHQCWSGEPEHRPSFTQLVESLSSSLEEMAGYVHIGAFGQNRPEVPQ